MEPSPLPSRSTKPKKHGVLPGAAIPQPPQNGLPTPRKPIPNTEALGEAEALELADIHFETRPVHPSSLRQVSGAHPISVTEKCQNSAIGRGVGYLSPNGLGFRARVQFLVVFTMR